MSSATEYRLPFEAPIYEMEARLAEMETSLAKSRTGVDASTTELAEQVRRIRKDLAGLKRSVEWHLAHPPMEPDPGFDADERALAHELSTPTK